jgi:hypothetical protein
MNLGHEFEGIGGLVDTVDFVDIDGSREHTEEAIKQLGEVFTPTPLVNEMLDKLPSELFINPKKTFLDNSCGNGQFLAAVLKRKMASGILHSVALRTIYGVELNPENAGECRQRLLMGFTHPELVAIVENNIICADALDPLHKGWKKVGFYWEKPLADTWFDC